MGVTEWWHRKGARKTHSSSLGGIIQGLSSRNVFAQLERAADEASKLLNGCSKLADHVELSCRITGGAATRHEGGELVEEPMGWHLESRLTLWRGERTAVCRGDDLDATAWQRRIADAIFENQALFPEDGRPEARLPGPMTFDPELVDHLAREGTLFRLGAAFRDNLKHEGERITGLQHFSARLGLQIEQHLVGRGQSVVGSIHGALSTQFEINSIYGDRLLQVHAPDSFLPFALLGARTWRNMPSRILAGNFSNRRGRAPLLLHPRALEAILRALGPEVLCDAHRSEVPLFSGQLTLTDDPLTDGIFRSRGFDDVGRPSSRTPLFVRGRPVAGRTRSIFSSKPNEELGVWFRSGGRVDGDPLPKRQFSCLVAERGGAAFNDLAASQQTILMISALSAVEVVDRKLGRFVASVRWGMRLNNGQSNALVTPDSWRIIGTLYGEGGSPGVFDEARLSRELNDTGSSILPYCLLNAEVEYSGG